MAGAGITSRTTNKLTFFQRKEYGLAHQLYAFMAFVIGQEHEQEEIQGTNRVKLFIRGKACKRKKRYDGYACQDMLCIEL